MAGYSRGEAQVHGYEAMRHKHASADPGHTRIEAKHFYVSAVDGKKKHLIAGPYPTHDEALAQVQAVSREAEKGNDRAVWMMWGTAGSEEPMKTPLGAGWKPKDHRSDDEPVLVQRGQAGAPDHRIPPPPAGLLMPHMIVRKEAIEHDPDRPAGHIASGDQLWSKSGRKLSLVPKFSTGGAGGRRSVSKLQDWLVDEAKREGVDTGANVWARDRLHEMDARNISPDDSAFLREALFGHENGPLPKHRRLPS